MDLGKLCKDDPEALRKTVAHLKANSEIHFDGGDVKTFEIATVLEKEGIARIEDKGSGEYILRIENPAKLDKLEEVIITIDDYNWLT